MRTYSLAYLTAPHASVSRAITLAASLGYGFVGLRLQPNAPGAPHQPLLGNAALLREARARLDDSGVGVFDLEIIRIGEAFDPGVYLPLLEAGAALGARAVLVAGDDANEERLAQNYARLCELMRPYHLSADLEFMPWTGVKHAQAALRVVQRAGTPQNAGVLVDALHFGRSASTLQDIAALPAGLLHYAQICDAPAGQHFSTEAMIQTAREARMLPGEGSIDVRGLFAALPQSLPVSVEIPDFKRAAVLGEQAWAAAALAACKRVLGDA